LMSLSFAGRIAAALLLSAALYTILAVGAHTRLTQAEAERMAEQLEGLIREVNSPLTIFINNFSLSLLMALPFIGLPIASWISYETGRYFSALSMIGSIDVNLLIMIPLILIYGLLEFIGYGGMVSGGLIMSYKILKREGRGEAKYYLLTLLVSSVVILVAALVEYYIISVMRDFMEGWGIII